MSQLWMRIVESSTFAEAVLCGQQAQYPSKLRRLYSASLADIGDVHPRRLLLEDVRDLKHQSGT